MTKTIKFLALGFAISLLAACGEPKLDTSTDETMKSSVQNIMAELSPEDQEKFKKTITGIYMIGALASMGEGKSTEEIKESINSKLDDKTAIEIFEVADEIRQKMNEKNKK